MGKLLKILIIPILICIFIDKVESIVPVPRIIREFLQNNGVGQPLTHEIQEYEFDPDVAKKRREQFYELHGYRGEKVIERIGLGIDGKHRERLAEQQQRDNGHLQGDNYKEIYGYLRGRKYLRK